MPAQHQTHYVYVLAVVQVAIHHVGGLLLVVSIVLHIFADQLATLILLFADLWDLPTHRGADLMRGIWFQAARLLALVLEFQEPIAVNIGWVVKHLKVTQTNFQAAAVAAPCRTMVLAVGVGGVPAVW
jgi:hypothetical protein